MEGRITIFAICLIAAFAGTARSQGSSCEGLASLALPNVRIAMAEAIPAGALTLPGVNNQVVLPAFCRVRATLTPSSDSFIKMELWLPASGWNGNLEGNGNGGWTGSINPRPLADALTRGYATAMSDLGHEGGRATFAVGHPEKLIDFGYRAAHEMTVASKALIAKFYGHAPKFSYWNGCSAGGRSGLMEAQRYPADYDGIVAGSPGLNWTGRSVQAIWIAQAVHKNEASAIPPEKFPLIHRAVLQVCDALDGLQDGIIEDPTSCRFDPKQLECHGANTSACLTAAQVETARMIYAPPTNPRTKQVIFPGFERGSELGWSTMAGPVPFRLATDLFKYIVFMDPNWDYKTFDFDRDEIRTEKADSGIMNAMNPDLTAFSARGGKLIQYHGWADPQIAPASSTTYYQAVLDTMGGINRVKKFYRLFMVPGMAHCGGGEGTSSFDMLPAIEDWVQRGHAPDAVPASRIMDGKVDRTRPLCPYPGIAHYKGSGSIDDSGSFICSSTR